MACYGLFLPGFCFGLHGLIVDFWNCVEWWRQLPQILVVFSTFSVIGISGWCLFYGKIWQAAWKAWGEISCEISWKSQTVLLKQTAADVMVIQSSHQAMVISSQTWGPRQQKLTTLCRSIRHIMQYIRYPPAIKHGLLENHPFIVQ